MKFVGSLILIGTVAYAGLLLAALGGVMALADARNSPYNSCLATTDLSIVTPENAVNFDNPTTSRVALPLGGHACDYVLRDGSIYRATSSWNATIFVGIGTVALLSGAAGVLLVLVSHNRMVRRKNMDHAPRTVE